MARGSTPMWGRRFGPGQSVLSGGGHNRVVHTKGSGLSSDWVNQTQNFRDNTTVVGGRIDKKTNGAANIVIPQQQSQYGALRKLTSTSVVVGPLFGVDFADTGAAGRGIQSISSGGDTVTGLSTDTLAYILVEYDDATPDSPHAGTWSLQKKFNGLPENTASLHYWILGVVEIGSNVITRVKSYWSGGLFIYYNNQ